MTFEIAARMFKQRLNNLGYKTKNTSYFDSCEFYYLENYYDSVNLFKIDYEYRQFLYAASPSDYAWTTINNYNFPNLKSLYTLSKEYFINAKKQRVNNKIKDIEKDFK